MTGHAGTDDLSMIYDNAWLPESGAVTVLTNVGGADVIERLAGRGHTIMTVTTGLGGDVLVVEVGR